MSSRLKFAFMVIPVLALSSYLIAGCGSSNKSSTSPTQAPTRAAAANPTTAPTSAPAAAAPSATRPAATAAPSGSGSANSISIADFSFTPARFNATAGQQVSLNVTNNGQFPHTFTITGLVDSGTIAPGQSKTVTFTPTAAGNLIYFCMIHGQATMSGQLMVAGTSGSAPAPGGNTTGGASSSTAPTPASSDSTTTTYDYGY